MKIKSPILQGLFLAALTTAAFTSASAETIYGVNGSNSLLTFDSATPGTIVTSVPITGTSGDVLNIDIRPATGQLFGLDFNNNLYTINALTGAASLVGGTTISSGFDYGFDFNPTVDRIRVITDAASNFRLNPNTAGTTNDLALDYITGDPNDAATPTLVGAAYTNNFALNFGGSTTLYAIDSALDILARSTNANNGTYVTQGSLGLDVTGLLGFDISGQTGTAYASLSTDGFTSSLYSIDLLTGAATSIGGIGSNQTILDIAAPSAVPEPATTLFGLAVVGAAALRRRRAARA